MFDFLERKDFKKFKKQELFKKLQPQVKEIAIYKGGGGLGDLVVGVPFFKCIKRAFPDANIKYMGIVYPRFKNVFKSIPYFDGYIHYERPDKGKRIKEFFDFKKNMQGKIDLIIDTQRRWETSFWLRALNSRYMISASPLLSNWGMPLLNYKKMHILEQLFTLPARLGMDVLRDLSCDLYIDEEYEKNADEILGSKAKDAVALMPSCGMEFKNWIPEYFARLGDLFAKLGFTIIILGSPKELKLFKNIAGQMKSKPIIPAEINLSMSEELMNDAAILKRCKVAVGNDSGGMHLASCLGVLSATIFGPTTPRKFSPIGPKNIVFYKNLSCSPCRFKCSQDVYRRCLVEITPDGVFDACIKELRK